MTYDMLMGTLIHIHSLILDMARFLNGITFRNCWNRIFIWWMPISVELLTRYSYIDWIFVWNGIFG